MNRNSRGYQQDHPDLRGTLCQRDGCGQTIIFVHTLAGFGAFCSEQCRNLIRDGRALTLHEAERAWSQR